MIVLTCKLINTIRSLSLTKVLAIKTLLTIDHLLDAIYEFVKGEINVQRNREQHDSVLVKRKGEKLYHSQENIQ